MMKKIILILFSSFFFLITSCKKADLLRKKQTILTSAIQIEKGLKLLNRGELGPESVYNFFLTQASGVIGINTFRTLYNENSSARLQGFVKTGSGTALPIQISSTDIEPINDSIYDSGERDDLLSFYGNTQPVTLNFTVNGQNISKSFDFKFPALLQISNPQDFYSSNGLAELNAGRNIRWNRDYNVDDNYVGISIRQWSKIGEQFKSNGRVILDSDEGYVFTEADFEPFEGNIPIEIIVSRGRLEYIEDETGRKTMFGVASSYLIVLNLVK